MVGEAQRSRWPLLFGGVAVFGFLVLISGVMFASVPITVQGVVLLAVGVLGAAVTLARRPSLPRRPSHVPWALPAGAALLVATTVESARTGVSVWAPLGLLTGVVLLGVAVRALPATPRPVREPRAAVVLVTIGLVLMVGYEALRHLLAPSAGDLPSYLSAVGMPFAAAAGAGGLAVLAATRGGIVGLAAAGALVLASAGLSLARSAGDAWFVRHPDVAGDTAEPMLTPGYRIETVAISYGNAGTFPDTGATTLLLVVGLTSILAGWWWAAVRRSAG